MKRALSLLLCLGMLTVPVSAARSPEWNVPDWAAGAYADLWDASAMPYSFSFSGPISRGAFVHLLVCVIQAAVPQAKLDAIPPVGETYFADVNPGLTHVRYGAAYGITQGRIGEDGLRYGDFGNGLTRQEAAKMVCSALDFFTGLGYQMDLEGEEARYADAAAIADWAAPYTGRVAAYQIMVGDSAGNFAPGDPLDWPSSVVIASRTLGWMRQSILDAAGALPLESALDWVSAASFGSRDNQVAKPQTGYSMGYYTAVDADGTVTGVVVPPVEREYDEGPEYIEVPPESFYVERYDDEGKVTFSKTLPMELPIFGAFLAAGDTYYLAFGQENLDEESGREVYRIVRYDKDWNRVGAASVTGGESYTTLPFLAAVARMAVNGDGSLLTLHAARQRYTSDDGRRHQSNITIRVRTDSMKVEAVSTEFPSNHVSHSFGQFIQSDGREWVTVDHGDAYPRSFVLQTVSGGAEVDLLKLAGATGDNVTNAIGSGLEVSDSGYLFLGCSADQDLNSGAATPWNVFLTYTEKGGSKASFTWLTDSDETIDCARLVKVDEDTFAALWAQSDGLHCQRLDDRGKAVGIQKVLEGVPMPPTQPAVRDGKIVWIQSLLGTPCLFTLNPKV